MCKELSPLKVYLQLLYRLVFFFFFFFFATLRRTNRGYACKLPTNISYYYIKVVTFLWKLAIIEYIIVTSEIVLKLTNTQQQ